MTDPNETGIDVASLAEEPASEPGSPVCCRAALERARVRLARRGPVDIRLVRQSVVGEVSRPAERPEGDAHSRFSRWSAARTRKR